ncbi:MAG: cytochrome b N-terminal domain-containing protein [Bacteroidetes bacterium]|nr:cytochrome b N-terminal domain-containing protein [Bacteroidota bacterium]
MSDLQNDQNSKSDAPTGVLGWLGERYQIQGLIDYLAKKEVPSYRHSFWYYMGGLSLLFFMVQIVTGILLLFYYTPGKEAYSSVKFIVEKVEFGWLIRSIHSYAANLMVFFVFVHMFSVIFMKAYRRPRELTYITGFILLALSMGMGFSGYLLPWDELAFFATKIGMNITESVPLIGPIMAGMLKGGPEVGFDTISRFFALHVWGIPLLMIGVLGAHMFFLQVQGISEPDGFKALPVEKQKRVKFFPTFMYDDFLIWLIALNGLIVLAVFFPWGLGPEANVMAPTPEGIHPEWYFMAMFQILKILPNIGPLESEHIGNIIFGLTGAILALIPFWGNNRERLVSYFTIAVLAGLIIFSILAYHAVGSI